MQYLTRKKICLTFTFAVCSIVLSTVAIRRLVMEHAQQIETSPAFLIELRPCETCLERGRRRLGVHPVGAGFLCDPCFKGEGTQAERADYYTAPGEQEARRSYRQRNLKKFREYQKRYRLHQRENVSATKR